MGTNLKWYCGEMSMHMKRYVSFIIKWTSCWTVNNIMVLNEFTFFVAPLFLSIHENSYFFAAFFVNQKQKSWNKTKEKQNAENVYMRAQKDHLAAFFITLACVCRPTVSNIYNLLCVHEIWSKLLIFCLVLYFLYLSFTCVTFHYLINILQLVPEFAVFVFSLYSIISAELRFLLETLFVISYL